MQLGGTLLPGAVADRERACREPFAGWLLGLCVRVHGLAEAAYPAKHRDRRRRRRRTTARGLGGGYGLGERHRGAPVLHRVLLDATPLLGVVAVDEGRVREGRCADDAGRAGRGGDTPPNPALHSAALRRDPASVLRGRLR